MSWPNYGRVLLVSEQWQLQLEPRASAHVHRSMMIVLYAIAIATMVFILRQRKVLLSWWKEEYESWVDWARWFSGLFRRKHKCPWGNRSCRLRPQGFGDYGTVRLCEECRRNRVEGPDPVFLAHRRR